MKENIISQVREIMDRFGITLYGALPLSDCLVYNQGLLARKLPDCQSVLLFAVPYYNGPHPERNISLYAAPRDYHLFFSMLEREMVPCFASLFPGANFALTADHSPIDERDAALKLGLGVKGDNHLLITKEYGSFVFLAEVLSTLPADTFYRNGMPPLHAPKECFHCGACRRACPSPDFCLSAITQKKGELTEKEVELILTSGILWGCDVCQTVCPLNSDIALTPIPFFKKETMYVLTAETVRAMSKEEFGQRAFSFRGRNTILRNLTLWEEKP